MEPKKFGGGGARARRQKRYVLNRRGHKGRSADVDAYTVTVKALYFLCGSLALFMLFIQAQCTSMPSHENTPNRGREFMNFTSWATYHRSDSPSVTCHHPALYHYQTSQPGHHSIPKHYPPNALGRVVVFPALNFIVSSITLTLRANESATKALQSARASWRSFHAIVSKSNLRDRKVIKISDLGTMKTYSGTE
jgi:hypothetical protein